MSRSSVVVPRTRSCKSFTLVLVFGGVWASAPVVLVWAQLCAILDKAFEVAISRMILDQ